jgi:hypothetical protein
MGLVFSPAQVAIQPWVDKLPFANTLSDFISGEMFMTLFAVGEQVIVRYGNHQGEKATIINNRLPDIYRVKVESGSVLFYSGKGLEKAKGEVQQAI